MTKERIDKDILLKNIVFEISDDSLHEYLDEMFVKDMRKAYKVKGIVKLADNKYGIILNKKI